MENISKNYLRMREKCVTYLDRIDILREQVYGRFVYLDCIEPYYSNKKNNPKPIGLEDFINTIVNYCTSFDETVSPKFMESMTEEDVVFAKAFLRCSFYFLKDNCPYDDYTFLGLNKIIKTAINNYSDENSNNPKANTFWNLYDKLPESRKDALPDDIKSAYAILFDDINNRYISLIADKLTYGTRYFMYDNDLDYFKNPYINGIVLDMIDETSSRLSRIYEGVKFHRSHNLGDDYE